MPETETQNQRQRELSRPELLHNTIEECIGRLSHLAEKLHLSVTNLNDLGCNTVKSPEKTQGISLAEMLTPAYTEEINKRCSLIGATLMDIENILI